MPRRWIADRMSTFDSSGIRKVFDLAAQLTDPINLSIGQPDFDVPEPVKQAAIEAIRAGRNAYTPTQGLPELREALAARIGRQYDHADRRVLVTSGTSGALTLALEVLVNPGDEVIFFDPYFVMYPALVNVVGGRGVIVDTYPDFRIDVDRVRQAITPRTKAILVNSPANPTGAVVGRDVLCGLAQLAAEHDVVLISDEIYSGFAYDEPFVSPAEFNPDVLVIDGFSKSHGMTGWRLGFAHGPAEIIQEMTKLQQYTFVCAPQPVQWAGLTALDLPMDAALTDYRHKRDLMLDALAGALELERPGGAFYMFPRAPWGSGTEFVEAAIRAQVLIIPGSIFSRADTHFRLSFAAPDATLLRGAEVLVELARRGPSAGR